MTFIGMNVLPHLGVVRYDWHRAHSEIQLEVSRQLISINIIKEAIRFHQNEIHSRERLSYVQREVILPSAGND
jgi:hypothetical protein